MGVHPRFQFPNSKQYLYFKRSSLNTITLIKNWYLKTENWSIVTHGI
jgi:hypothetical protein